MSVSMLNVYILSLGFSLTLTLPCYAQSSSPVLSDTSSVETTELPKAPLILKTQYIAKDSNGSKPVKATLPTHKPNLQNAVDIDYRKMNVFIDRFSMRQKGRQNIAYERIRDDGMPFLNNYIQFLSGYNITSLSDDGQLAHWLNLHNAVVLRTLTLDTKKKNLEKKRGSLLEPGKLWTQPQITVDGKELSLSNIEDYILMKWPEPDVIFGMYQGIQGGPALERLSYEADSVRLILDDSARTYINARGIVTLENQTVKVTPFLTWKLPQLFENSNKALIQYIREKSDPNLKASLFRAKTLEVIELNYNRDILKKSEAKTLKPFTLKAPSLKPAN